MTSPGPWYMQSERLSSSQWLVDAVVAAGAFGFACLQLVLAINLLVPDPGLRRLIGVQNFSPTPLAILLVALTTAPLAARRKFPWPVFIVTGAVWSLLQFQIGAVSVSLVGPLVALFTLAMMRPRAESIAAGAILMGLVVIAPFSAANQALTQLTLLQNLALVAAVWFAGFALQTRQDYVRAAEERARAAETTRESLARQRVEAERVRIAREVHDITAHSLSAVSIQAAAAEKLMDHDPDAAREAISDARQTAKTALQDIRAMIGVLREGDEAVAAADDPQGGVVPTRGTDHLPELVTYLRDGGVEARLDDRRYDRSRVPGHIDVALFRIAREACTNILRHAQAASATIRLWTAENEACLEVRDFGRGQREDGAAAESSPATARPPAADGGGHGIQGMAERVALLSGRFSAAPVPASDGGGFVVSVAIPLRK